MGNQDMRRTLYKNARFEAVTTTERSRRRTEIQRKEGRERHIQQHRKIEASPSPQPVVRTELSRREKLLRWKAEREAILLAEKAKKKPPFKVGAFQGLAVKETTLQRPKPVKKVKVNVTAPTISDTRRITRSQAKLAQVTESKIFVMPTHPKTGNKVAVQKPGPEVSFAPPDHVFKPPINLTFPVTPDLMKRTKRVPLSQTKTGGKPVQPSNLLENNMSENSQGLLAVRASEDDASLDNQCKRTPAKRRSTRLATPKVSSGSGASGLNAPLGESPTKQAKKAPNEQSSGKAKNKEDDEFVVRTVSRMSIHSPTRVAAHLFPEPTDEVSLPAESSPFIVTGRGVDRHRSRRSRGNDSFSVTSVDHKKAEQVKHFRLLLDDETNRLLELCDKWDNLKSDASEDLPSDIQDSILAAVGQARLLTKDKFQQFKKLVDKFEQGTSDEEKITTDDLTGFWEMVQVTVNSSNNQFKKLSDLQNNGWKEEVKVVRKKAVSVLGPRTNNIRSEAMEQSKARIREAMAAARKLKLARLEQSRNKSNEKSFDGGFFKIESPKSKTENVPVQKVSGTPKTVRKSLLQTVLTNSANRVVKSPSVSKVSDRIRVSLVGRRTSLSVPDEDPMFVSPPPSLTAVPAKSILKSANKSAKRHTVVFNHAEEGLEKEGNAIQQSSRRSLRFNVGTKFNDSPI